MSSRSSQLAPVAACRRPEFANATILHANDATVAGPLISIDETSEIHLNAVRESASIRIDID
jgi:hypothetical protein